MIAQGTNCHAISIKKICQRINGKTSQQNTAKAHSILLKASIHLHGFSAAPWGSPSRW
jgi:hypothetical protein